MSSFETAGDSSNDALLTGLTRLAVAFGEFRKETTERLDTIDARLDEYEHAHGSETASKAELVDLANAVANVTKNMGLAVDDVNTFKEALGVNPMATTAGILKAIDAMIYYSLIRANYGEEAAEQEWQTHVERYQAAGYGVQTVP